MGCGLSQLPPPASVKVAITERSLSMMKERVVAELLTSPLHPPNTYPASGWATSSTVLPSSNTPPSGLTEPLPTILKVRVYLGISTTCSLTLTWHEAETAG